ncbi:hypothetical protein ACHAXT_009047 [Thalassiosira profunda]
MTRFADRRHERQEKRQERRHGRRGSSLGCFLVCSSTSSSDSDSSEAFNNTYVMHQEGEPPPRRRSGRTEFYVDAKKLRVRDTIKFRKDSRHGDVLYEIQERKLRARDAMTIEDGNGKKVAEIKKRKVGVVRENFVVKVKGDRDWQIHGSVLDHEFKVKEGGKTIVEVHKNWVTPIKDAYFIDVDYDDQALALAVVCGLENLAESRPHANAVVL